MNAPLAEHFDVPLESEHLAVGHTGAARPRRGAVTKDMWNQPEGDQEMTEYIRQLEAARLRFGDQSIKKVMLPTDFSEKSLRPLGIAVEMAAAAGAELHIVHAEDPLIGPPKDARRLTDEDVRSTVWGASPDSLRAWAESNLSNLVIRWDNRQAIDPAKEIVDYVDEHSVDLVVMGTAARRGLVRAFLGSVAERVVLHSSCPVLLLGEDAPESYANPELSVLVPIDFSEPSLASLAHAETLCESLGGELCLLHAISPAPMPAIYGDFSTTVWEYQDVGGRVKAQLERLALKVSPQIRTSVVVRRGSAARSIVEVAEERQVDLIVIGSRGLSGFARHFVGSVAQRVARLASVPVMIFKDRLAQEGESAD